MAILKIGTRGSPLALAQARMVRALISENHNIDAGEIEIVTIVTTGDKIQDKTLALSGGKGLFTKEIEEALIEKRVDMAVHSMKDVPTFSQDGLKISTVLAREDVRDAFISEAYQSLAELPKGAVVGTASLRRQAQLKRLRPDLKIVPFRGNVETRLRKLKEGVVDATLLASAGLNRLGMQHHIGELLSIEQFLPAVAQGAIGVEVRSDNQEVEALLGSINNTSTYLAVTAERAFLRVLDGSCRTPIAAYAKIKGEELRLRGQILMPDGSSSYSQEITGLAEESQILGEKLGRSLRLEAGEGFMADIERLSQSSY